MSVDTVNTIVDITTLAEVQNQLTVLADPATMTGDAVQCTDKTMADVCKDPNTTCSAKCTAAFDTPPAADVKVA